MKQWKANKEKFLAGGLRSGWNQAIEVDENDKPTGNKMSVQAPAPEMAMEAIQVLEDWFNKKAHFSDEFANLPKPENVSANKLENIVKALRDADVIKINGIVLPEPVMVTHHFDSSVLPYYLSVEWPSGARRFKQAYYFTDEDVSNATFLDNVIKMGSHKIELFNMTRTPFIIDFNLRTL